MNSDDTLTIREAYVAMYAFLENEYLLTKSDDIGGLLGGMSLLADGGTADPGAWESWIDAVRKMRSGDCSIQLEIRPD